MGPSTSNAASTSQSSSSRARNSYSTTIFREDPTQRPFKATSEGLSKVARKQGVRMNEAEITNKMGERWRAHLEYGDRRAENKVDAPPYSHDRESLHAWWSPSELEAIQDELRGAVKRPDARGDQHNPTTMQHAQELPHFPSSEREPHALSPLAEWIQARLSDNEQPYQEQRLYPADAKQALNYRNFKDTRFRQNSIGVPPDTSDDTLTLLLPLLVLLSTLLFLLLIFIVLVVFVRRRTRIALSDGGGPLDVGREEELEGHGGLDGVEERWLETVDEPTRRGYARAKDWSLSFPPGSQSSEITLSQFLSIQEKGVSAWSFDPDYENNPSVFVEARTEITFLADGEGMAPHEGGGCSVQSNLPLPKLNEVYYWEAKMFSKPENTSIAVGLATKPYPSFRMPGWSKYSVGFFSADGFKCHNFPFTAQSYGPPYLQGDVIGVGYRPRSGTVFFTRNGKKLEDAYVGLNRYNLFPTIGADGSAEVHVNLGQAGFVFIEANVKKWGLAPMVGTLAPPPAYGMERGSILIETGQGSSVENRQNENNLGPPRPQTPPPPLTPPSEEPIVSSLSPQQARRVRQGLPTAPYEHHHIPATADLLAEQGSASSGSHHRTGSPSSVDEPHNPPTPNHLDISMHSLDGSGGDDYDYTPSRSTTRGRLPNINLGSYFPQLNQGDHVRDQHSPSPPPYNESRHSWNGDTHISAGTSGQSRRREDPTNSFTNALFGALSERGLLTPLSRHDAVIAPTPRQQEGSDSWLASWFR